MLGTIMVIAGLFFLITVALIGLVWHSTRRMGAKRLENAVRLARNTQGEHSPYPGD